MSKKYRVEKGFELNNNTSPEMRLFCSRPGRVDENGKIMYYTEQHHKKECDVNLIIKKFDKTGLISHVSKIEARFGDLTGADFKKAQDLMANSMSMFNMLPSEIRKRFRNSPQYLLEFMENGDNREEAIKLGLIKKEWTEDSDGLGEHVLEGQNILKDPHGNIPDDYEDKKSA